MPTVLLGDRQPVERREPADLVQRGLRPQPVTPRWNEEAIHRATHQARRRCGQEPFRIEARIYDEVERARASAQPADGRVVTGTQARAGLDENRALAVCPDELGVRGPVPD